VWGLTVFFLCVNFFSFLIDTDASISRTEQLIGSTHSSFLQKNPILEQRIALNGCAVGSWIGGVIPFSKTVFH